MDENKKGKFFKGLRGKDKKEKIQEVEASPEAPAAEPIPEPEPFLTQDFTEKNRLDKVYQLYSRWCKYNEQEPERVLFSEWMKVPVETDEDPNLEGSSSHLEMFRKQMVGAATKVLQQLDDVEKKAKKRDEEIAKIEDPEKMPEPIKFPPDIDAAVHVQVAKGNLVAFVCVFPPFGDGEPLTKVTLDETLEKSKVVSGIRKETISALLGESKYFQIFPIAVGLKPVAGKNGEIIEHIPREQMLSFEEDEEGKVDYRDLNLFRNIEQGEVICDIILPDSGEDGMDVKGDVIKAIPGKAAKVPAGSHTEITEDGTKLIASQNGYISFQYGKFRIEDRLVINGNIDMSVGNQDFLGDIFVQGDVISGFTLKATGSIYIQGSVEGATLIAGENIEIGDGMNGNNRGVLRAGRSVHSPFLENVEVHAMSNIRIKSMIGCEVYCNDTIYAEQGIGVIIGGSLTVGKAVIAKTIGSKSYRKTEIFLGIMPELRTEKEEKVQELKTVKKTQDLLEKNIYFLRSMESLPDDKMILYKQLVEQESLYRKMIQRLEAEIEHFDKMASDFSKCVVRSSMVYPPTRVTIGNDTYSLETATAKCRFYLSDENHVALGID